MIEALTAPQNIHAITAKVAMVVSPQVTAPCNRPPPDVLVDSCAATHAPRNKDTKAVTKYQIFDQVATPPGLDKVNPINRPNAVNSTSVASATKVPPKTAGHETRFQMAVSAGAMYSVVASAINTSPKLHFLIISTHTQSPEPARPGRSRPFSWRAGFRLPDVHLRGDLLRRKLRHSREHGGVNSLRQVLQENARAVRELKRIAIRVTPVGEFREYNQFRRSYAQSVLHGFGHLGQQQTRAGCDANGWQ